MEKGKRTFPKFEFNSDLGLVTIDGKALNSVREININRKEGEEFSVVSLKFDANVSVKGDMLILPSLIGRERLVEASNCILAKAKKHCREKNKKSPNQ